MELNELKTELISYYCKHKATYVQNVTMEYIESNYPEKSLDKLHLAILKSHPFSWGFPDVSAIETAAERFMKSDSMDLKNKKEIDEYKNPIEPLTDQELIESEENGSRDKWLDIVGNVTEKATDILDPEKMEEVKRELSQEKKA